VRRLERSPRVAQHICKCFSGLVRRLHAEHQLQTFAADVEPGDAALRLKKHRIDGLGFEFAVQHQQIRIVRCEFCTNPLAVGRRFDIRRAFRYRQYPPDRPSVVLKARTDPAFLDRRIDIRRVGAGPGHARKAKRAIVRLRNGAGVLAKFHECAVAELEPRLIEGVEGLEHQQRHRLAHVEWRLAHWAEQVTGIELGHADVDFRKLLCRDHHRRPQRAAQALEVHAGVDVRGVRSADEHGVRGLRRPAGEIGATEIGCVELGTGDLGGAVDATDTGCRRVPAMPSGQGLARFE
jgi:hypothetical protein